MLKKLGWAILFISTSALASSWEHVTGNLVDKDNFTEWEIDTSSLVIRDGLRQAWIRYSISPKQTLPYDTTKVYGSYVALTHFNCEYRESASSQTVFYSQAFSNGEVVYSRSIKKSEIKDALDAVVPNSYGESLLEKACGIKLKK